MRNLLIVAAILVGAGSWVAQTASKMTAVPAGATSEMKATASARVEKPAPTGSRTLSIPRDARGHFQTEGRIDG